MAGGYGNVAWYGLVYVIGRTRIALGLAALGVVWDLAACGGPGAPSTSQPSSTSIRSVSPTSRETSTGCSNMSVVNGWPIARRAALVVVAPVLNFSTAAMQVAIRAGAGGILYLGGDRPPPNLPAQLHGVLAGSPHEMAPLVMADEEGGGVQRLQGIVPSLPWARDMAMAQSPGQVEDLAASVGHQMLQLGVNVDLAPVLDLDGGNGPSASDADGLRSFSPDTAMAARYGVAFLQGLRTAGVLPVVKHFPGLGGASRNTDYGQATTLPLATLRGTGLLPFQAAIAARAPAVMVGNAVVPGLTDLPASLSPDVISGLLRHTLGFDGLVLTDSLSAGAVAQSGYDVPRAAVAAIASGADMILFGSTLIPAQTLLLSPRNVSNSIRQIVDALVRAAASGSVPVSRLNNAVQHILDAVHTNLCTR